MPLEFGYIQDYKDRTSTGKTGFGFVSRVIRTSGQPSNNVYFHIKQIKGKYPELAAKLDGGAWQGIGIWYVTEASAKGIQVSEAWLEVQDIPDALSKKLQSNLEQLWMDIHKPLPGWVSEITLKLCGEANRDELKHRRLLQEREQRETRDRKNKQKEEESIKRLQQMILEATQRDEGDLSMYFRPPPIPQPVLTRQEPVGILNSKSEVSIVEPEEELDSEKKAKKIREFCSQRQITVVTHFTSLANLNSILSNGLLSHQALKTTPCDEQPKINDLKRIDGHPEAVCLSISFPNYRMFYAYSQYNQADWVVLEIDASVLWEQDCAFCRENAASNNVRFISIPDRKKFQSFEGMFADFYHIQRKDLGIPSSYTTNPQAEVLSFDAVPTRYITSVHFYSEQVGQFWLRDHPKTYPQTFFASRQYFSPRVDYAAWRSPSLNTVVDLE